MQVWERALFEFAFIEALEDSDAIKGKRGK